MDRRRPRAYALIGITVSAAFMIGAPAYASEGSRLTMAAPPGFEDLAAERQLLLDVWFGGRKLGEARVRVAPGLLTFEDPAAVAALVPEVARPLELRQALEGALETNVSRLCGASREKGCGSIEPLAAGVILDEERFRVDLFVNPALLETPDQASDAYLDRPGAEPSLISLFGATLSGSNRGDQSWHVQNRTIAAVGSLRVRSDMSLSSGTGVTIDNLAAEKDLKDWRYIAGIFWAPGTELVGRRRIAGIGATTQLDTLQDRDALSATPLVLALQHQARVELLVDGRLVSSRIYPAGNRLVDTEALPGGSYEVLLRIQEDGLPVRIERRFFSRGTLMAPLGRPQFAAFAGILPSAGPGLSLDHGDAFYQLSASYRVAPRIGLDASVLGTGRKAILDGGVVWQSGLAQVRLSALLSSSLDYGASIRASSSGKGPLAFSFDLRTIKSRDGRPLMPVASSRGTFSEDPEAGFGDRGSYTQAIGVASYRLGDANFRLTGLYRRGGTEDSTYSIGASVDMPVIRTGRWDIVVQADVRKSEHELASFLGVRFLLNRGELALSGSAGTIHQSGRPGDDERLVGEAQLAWARTLANEGQLSTDAAIGRDSDGSYARASAYARTPLVNARADLLHQFGDLATTQYAATLESGFVMSGHGVGMSGREMNDSAVEVSADGIEPGQRFELLVDEVARGTVGADRTTRVFLQPYRSYHIRLRPLGAQAASFDTAARQVTLYPGSVAALHWDVTPLFVLFGQAVDGLGRPVANAEIKGAFGIGRSDGEGYFQIETRSGDVLGFEPASAPACAVTVGKARQRDGYVSGGKVQCR
jgi:hypothetical protein